MNRRQFSIVLVSLPMLAAFKDGGCERRRDDMAALLQTLGTAVAQLATILGNQELSARIQHHTQAAVNLLRAWVPGQAAAAAITALNLLIDDLKRLLEAKFRPLVTLALGTIAAIIEKIRTLGTGAGEPPHTDIKLTQPPENSSQFKEYWDHIRGGTPGMEQAPVL